MLRMIQGCRVPDPWNSTDPDLKTAWDTFNPEKPGDSFRYVYEGIDIYGFAERLNESERNLT